MKYCTRCGKEMSQNSKFCVSCGAEFKNSNNEQKNKNDNHEIKKLGKIITWLTIITIAAVMTFQAYIDAGSKASKSKEEKTGYMAEKYKDVIEENDSALQKYRALLAENNTATKIDICAGENKLVILENNYKLFDFNNYDNDIRYNLDEMKVYGILKNNSSKCYAHDIKIKVYIKKENGDIMQEESLSISEPLTNAIYPNKTKGFSVKFEVYESLLDIQSYTRKLKTGLKVSIETSEDYSIPYVGL